MNKKNGTENRFWTEDHNTQFRQVYYIFFKSLHQILLNKIIKETAKGNKKAKIIKISEQVYPF